MSLGMWGRNFLLGGIVLSASALYYPVFFLWIWPLYLGVGGIFIKFIAEAVGVWLLYLAFRWLISLRVTLSPRAMRGTRRTMSWLGHSAIGAGHVIVLYGLYQVVFPERIYLSSGMYTISNEAPVPFFAFGYCYLLGLIAVFAASPSKEKPAEAVS